MTMEDKQKKEIGESEFQHFGFMNDLSSVLVSYQLMDEMKSNIDKKDNDVILVQKYLPINLFAKSIIGKYFYLAAPSEWEDPMETKYLEELDKSLKSKQQDDDTKRLKDMSIFCSCMTYNDTENEEASWKSYNKDMDNIIRVTYDFNKLCKILDKANEKIYIGRVVYKTRKEIIAPTKEGNKGEDKDLEQLFVNNFCFKQKAYSYEKELRFCKILDDEKSKNEKEYLINNVDLSPAIVQITLPPINNKNLDHYESMERIVGQLIKALKLKNLCPNVSVKKSNLYNSSEIEMTSELYM